MAKQTKSSKKTSTKAPRAERKCLCGCGKSVTNRFRSGHDAVLHSLVLKIARHERGPVKFHAETIAYLKSAPWMTSELAKAVLS